LTDVGAVRFENVAIQLYKRQQALLSIFSVEEQKQLLGQLTRLLQHMQTG
jgi:hypothetical protein